MANSLLAELEREPEDDYEVIGGQLPAFERKPASHSIECFTR
jgi:hypothetical protein